MPAELGEKRGMTEELLQNVLENVTEPGRFADLVAGYIDLPVPERQSLLETLAVEERLRRVLVHVQREIGMLDAQAEIKTQVQEELGERQREMYLREQLKAIQKRPEDVSYPGAAVALAPVWVAAREAYRRVLEGVTVADVVAGRLPDHAAELVAMDEAWRSFGS